MLKKYTQEKVLLHTYVFTEMTYTLVREFRGTPTPGPNTELFPVETGVLRTSVNTAPQTPTIGQRITCTL